MDINSYISSGIVEMYVMGLCSQEEHADVEMLRAQYPDLDYAIREFELSLENELQKTAIDVPEAVDEKILAFFNPPASATDNFTLQPTRDRGRSWVAYAIAAVSTALLGISLFTIYKLQVSLKKSELLVSANKPVTTLPPGDFKILNDPGITPVAMYGVGSHAICRCTMFWDKKTGKVYIILHHLPLSSDKSDYQLWAYVNGQPVNIGVINDAIRGRFIEMGNVPAGANSFSITLEKAGVVTTPTNEEMYLQGRI